MEGLERLLATTPGGLYAGLFVSLCLCGLGLPFPEEALFLTAGYLGREAGMNPWLLCLTGLGGILAGDHIPYLVGRTCGASLLKHPWLLRLFGARHLDRIQRFFQQRGAHAVLTARFVPGFRTPTFLVAGLMGTAWRTFVAWDLLGALVTCPVSVWLAYLYGRPVLDWFMRYHTLGGLLILLTGLIVLLAWLRFRRRPEPEHAAAANPPPVTATAEGAP